jgi:hypothetical protein
VSRFLTAILFLAPFATATGTVKAHRDYVPDEKTAARLAEAILVGQYGEERVKAQLPLHANGSNKAYWIVQGHAHQNGIPNKGGGFAVWINRHSGCIGNVVEHMK